MSPSLGQGGQNARGSSGETWRNIFILQTDTTKAVFICTTYINIGRDATLYWTDQQQLNPATARERFRSSNVSLVFLYMHTLYNYTSNASHRSLTSGCSYHHSFHVRFASGNGVRSRSDRTFYLKTTKSSLYDIIFSVQYMNCQSG